MRAAVIMKKSAGSAIKDYRPTASDFRHVIYRGRTNAIIVSRLPSDQYTLSPRNFSAGGRPPPLQFFAAAFPANRRSGGFLSCRVKPIIEFPQRPS